MRLCDFVDNFGATINTISTIAHFLNFALQLHLFSISALYMLFLSLGCTVLLVTFTVYASKFEPMSYALQLLAYFKTCQL